MTSASSELRLETIWEFYHPDHWTVADRAGYDLTGSMYGPLKEFVAEGDGWPSIDEMKGKQNAKVFLTWLIVLVQVCAKHGHASPRLLKVTVKFA